MGNQKEMLGKLRNVEAIFVPMSDCTRMPFVVCNQETYDDEVYVFFNEEGAKKECGKIAAQQNPMHLLKIEHKFLLSFYASLMPMGVNAIVIDKGTEGEMVIQLSDLINRKDNGTDAQGRPIVENQELTLTALYFMQKLRAKKDLQVTEELKELQEEMLAHYSRGRYIVAFQENHGVAILKQKDGKVLQPLFTDVQEFLKFQNIQKDTKFRTAVIEAQKIPEVLAKEAAGVVVNPFSINLQLQVKRKSQGGAAAEQAAGGTIDETAENMAAGNAKEEAVEQALAEYAKETAE